MGKRKKEITRIHAEEKKKKQEEENALAGLHPLLVWLKLFLIISLLGNLFMIVKDGVGQNDIADLIVNLSFLVLLVLSLIWHEKKGVYCFFAYGILEEHKDENIEIMCHPGWRDLELYRMSSYSTGRLQELSVLCDPDVIRYVQENNIELCHY